MKKRRVREGLLIVSAALVLAGVLTGVVAVGLPEQSSTRGATRPPALGLPPLPLDVDIKSDDRRVELGRKLFFDRRLSFNGSMSCAMCHVPEEGFTSQASQRAVGIEGMSLKRNAPTLLNLAWRQRQLFLDGRETSLVTQAWMPLLHPDEMANPSAGYLIDKLRSLDDYRGLFEKAFGAGATMDSVGAALASFQLTLVAGDSDFDRWMYGARAETLSTQAQAGYRLFAGKARCATCHTIGKTDALFSDGLYHVTGAGTAARSPLQPFTVPLAPGMSTQFTDTQLAGFKVKLAPDLGRYELTHVEDDRYAFRTPALRDVARTAPYMHDGSLATLEEVVDFYDRGGGTVLGKSERLQPLGLSAAEKSALVEFLLALNSRDYPALAARSRGPVAPAR